MCSVFRDGCCDVKFDYEVEHVVDGREGAVGELRSFCCWRMGG